MAKNSVDLNKLKSEIDFRKNERSTISSNKAGAAPRDSFLNGLLTSFDTGSETNSTKTIKLIENKIAIKNGETIRHKINEEEIVPQRNITPNRSTTNIDMSPERDEQLFKDIEQKRKKTLTESMQGYLDNNVNSHQSPMQQQPIQQQSMNLNEGYLVENVKKIVDNYLIDNFGPVVEEAIKSTILELYAVDRIKEVLHGNKELIKSLVLETIREIQAKAKANKKD